MDDTRHVAPATSTAPDTPRLAALTPAQRELHEQFVRSSAELRANIMRTIVLLTSVHERRLNVPLGFPSVGAYAAQFAGFSPRLTRDLLRLGRKLRQLPVIAEAVETGALPWTKAREICQHARPDQQADLLELARSCSRRELRQILAKGQADTADAPANPRAPRPLSYPPELATPRRPLPTLAKPATPPPRCPDSCPVTLHFDPEQHARWTALLERRASEVDANTLEDRLLALLAAGTPTDASAPTNSRSYLTVILKCPDCGAATVVTARGEAPASPPLIAAAACDGDVEDDRGHRRSAIAPRLRHLALQRARYRCEAVGCRNVQFLEVHHRQPVTAGGSNTLDNLIVLCSRCHRALHASEQQLRDDLGALTRGT